MSTINLKTNLQRVAVIDEQRYITSPVRYSTITAEDLINYACENSGIPKAQMASAFYAINQQIEQFVLNGHALTLGTLGTFYLSAKTKASETPEEAGTDAVVRISVKFRQSKRLRNLLNTGITLKSITVSKSESGNGSGNNDGGNTGGSTGGNTDDENPLG